MQILDDVKEYKRFNEILVKISHIFNDIYITKTLYILSLDIHKPFLLKISENDYNILVKTFGEFNILHINDVKKFKKEYSDIYGDDYGKIKKIKKQENETDEDIIVKENEIKKSKEDKKINIINDLENFNNHFNIVNSKTEANKISKRLDLYLSYIYKDILFNDFVNDNNIEEISSVLFDKKEHINFTSNNNSRIIISKTLLPLITEKNLNILKYNDRELNDNLRLLILYFELDNFFEIYSLNFYINLKI